MSFPAIILPADPKEALEAIRSYLQTKRMDWDRAVKQEGEIVGYWQCTEWLEGLDEICSAIKRIP